MVQGGPGLSEFLGDLAVLLEPLRLDPTRLGTVSFHAKESIEFVLDLGEPCDGLRADRDGPVVLLELPVQVDGHGQRFELRWIDPRCDVGPLCGLARPTPRERLVRDSRRRRIVPVSRWHRVEPAPRRRLRYTNPARSIPDRVTPASGPENNPDAPVPAAPRPKAGARSSGSSATGSRDSVLRDFGVGFSLRVSRGHLRETPFSATTRFVKAHAEA